MERLQVGAFYQDMQQRLELELLGSAQGLSRFITQKNLHRPGLALAGFIELFTFDRVQVMGNTEIRYLKSLDSGTIIQSLQRVLSFEIPCLIVSGTGDSPPELPHVADEKGIALFRTKLSTTGLTQILTNYLDDKFAPSTVVHGSLVDVYGTGLLFTGRSGIGKSEIADWLNKL